MTYRRRTVLRAIGAGGIGATVSALAGSATAASTTITMRGAGGDIWGTADEFHFYYQQITGDFDVVVHSTGIESTDEWAKAGLMVRQRLNADSENAMIRRQPNGRVSFQWRSDNGNETESTTSGGTGESEVDNGYITADWLRLRRSGDTIEAYGSTDGSDWTRIAAIAPSQIDFAEDTYVGLAVTSHNPGVLCTASFESLSGLAPVNNQDVGDCEVSGSVSTNDGGGSGDTNPVVSTDAATHITETAATLNGTLEDLGGTSSAACHFENRESGTDSWNTTGSQILTSNGSFNQDISGLSRDTDYEYRAVVNASDGDTATGAVVSYTTSSDSGEEDSGTTSGGSYFDGGDGFASMAPWLDDNTQVITVSEPTRSALESALTASGPRVVVFETSGTIDLGYSSIEITNDKCWVAGQTAPSPGITLIKGKFQVSANDCVVQHIRSRRGQQSGEGEGKDAVNNADGTRNVVFDHVSAYWGRDENLSIGYNSTNTTVTNCLIAEGLSEPAENSNGTLVGDGASNVALLGNVYAKNVDRNPRLKSDTTSAIVNNVGGFYFNEACNLDDSAVTSFVGNGYIYPTDTEDPVVDGGSAYLEDNYATDPLLDSGQPFANTNELGSRPLWPSGLEAMSSNDIESHNLNYAGTRPADRDQHDQRIISEVRNRNGGWIGSQSDVGGYSNLPENTHTLPVPDSGLRDWLEQWALSVEEESANPP
jgi:hypothetical protein